MCETRWVENQDGLIKFTKIFKPIIKNQLKNIVDQVFSDSFS